MMGWYFHREKEQEKGKENDAFFKTCMEWFYIYIRQPLYRLLKDSYYELYIHSPYSCWLLSPNINQKYHQPSL